MWEETAWAGVVQTRLEHHHGLAKAALLTAVPFALFHMPLHFIGDFSIGSLAGALVTLAHRLRDRPAHDRRVPPRDRRKHPRRRGAAHPLQPQQQRRGPGGRARRRRRPQARRPALRPGPDRRGRDRRATPQEPGHAAPPRARTLRLTHLPITSTTRTRHEHRLQHRPPPSGAGSSHDQARQIMEAVAVAGKIPGMSVAVASPDRLLYAGAVGFADLQSASGIDRRRPVPVVLHDEDRHRYHADAAACRRSPRYRRPYRHLLARLPGTRHARSPHDPRAAEPHSRTRQPPPGSMGPARRPDTRPGSPGRDHHQARHPQA